MYEGHRALVCGGRDYCDRRTLYETLDRIDAVRGIGVLIAGGARGADQLAADWACAHKIPTLIYNADWELHGRSAGALRNAHMLKDGKPDFVIAFGGGRGTANMVQRALSAGVEVIHA